MLGLKVIRVSKRGPVRKKQLTQAVVTTEAQKSEIYEEQLLRAELLVLPDVFVKRRQSLLFFETTIETRKLPPLFSVCVNSVRNSTAIKHILVEFPINGARYWHWKYRNTRSPSLLTPAICGVTAMTENEASIPILSWYHKINFKMGVFVKPNCLSVAQVWRAQPL